MPGAFLIKKNQSSLLTVLKWIGQIKMIDIMSNKRWMEKLKNWNQKEGKEPERVEKDKRYCKGFEKGRNGCKHYMGCKIISRICVDECSV